MKILQVNKFYYLKGGSEAYLFNLESELKRLGHEVIQFSMSHPDNWDSPWSKFFVDNIDYYSGNFLENVKNSFKIIYSLEAKNKMFEARGWRYEVKGRRQGILKY